MRIAIVHYSKPPVIGGVERVIGEQAEALRSLGHEVRLWSADESSALREALGDDSSPLHETGPFLHPQRPIEKHRHILPHWHQGGAWCFITWRLADSLPQEFIREWISERDAWLREHPKPWNPDTETCYHERFSESHLERLDRGHGSCILRQEECSAAVEQALHFFDGERYSLKSFVIMPNHVHVLVRLHKDWPLERVVQNWKERSAKSINAMRGTSGQVWQKSYFDRLVRSADHWEFVSHYIAQNPAKAGLQHGFRLWSADESSAYRLGQPEVHRSLIDTIIVHNLFTMPFNLAWTNELIDLTQTRPDIRWINWVHDVRWSERIPDAIHVAVSEHRKSEYAKVANAPIHVIPNGVDSAKVLGLTERIQQLHLEHAGLILLQPTRFVRRKNIELGLRVLAELPEDTLYLVTAAPDPHQKDGVNYFRELKKLAKELGVAQRVLFLGEKTKGGVLSDDDVRGLYQMTDALFFPSTQEGYGLPLVEAALHGVPVFCSDIPVHREVAVDAAFFKLTSSPRGIARKVRSDVRVKGRQQRRRLMTRLNWPRITQEMLEPLLSGHASS
ncbi:MAG: glycosyltransferase [Prosthecobacter sp.]